MAKPKSKSKARKSKVFTISIHGEGVDIDARFEDGRKVGDAIGEIASRVSAGVTGAKPVTVTGPEYELSAIKELIDHIKLGIRPEQLRILADALDDEQRVAVLELLRMAGQTPPAPAPDEVVTRNPPASA